MKKFIKNKLREGLDISIHDILKNKLLSIESGVVKLGADTYEEIKDLLERGVNFKFDYITKKRGVPNQCHRNTAEFYDSSLKKLKKSKWKIVNGYAFSDGVWVSHSWLLNGTNISETVKIKFTKYYGYVLTPEESVGFCYDNF